MRRQLITDLRDLFAWIRSSLPGFVEYSGKISLMLFNASLILSVLFSPTLIALWQWPGWIGVALAANVIGLAMLAWIDGAYERSRT